MAAVSRKSLVIDYFILGLTYREIANCIQVRHGISISERHVKRLLSACDLKRRMYDEDVDVEPVIDFISTQLRGSGQLHGYRWMYYKSKLAGFNVRKETVRQICRELDEDGVTTRRKRRLRRRCYFANGPNYVWHIDGYDKLKPFGICISGCVDGFSRQIIWLKAGTTNNDPAVIAKYFLDSVRQLSGCPRIVRGDYGTENVKVREIQQYLRRNATDDRRGNASYIDGASTANQRIESWWGILRKESADYWMCLFRSVRDEGLFDGGFIDKSLLQFCFLGKIQVSARLLIGLAPVSGK